MRDAPRTLLNLVRAAAGDQQLIPQQIKESLARIWAQRAPAVTATVQGAETRMIHAEEGSSVRSRGAHKAWETRREKATRTTTPYDESHHTSGKPKEVLELYRAIDRFSLSLKSGEVQRRCLAASINYVFGKTIFCCVALYQGGLRVFLKLKYNHLENPPAFARDVSNVGHYGVGDLELAISEMSQLKQATDLIQMCFEGQLASLR